MALFETQKFNDLPGAAVQPTVVEESGVTSLGNVVTAAAQGANKLFDVAADAKVADIQERSITAPLTALTSAIDARTGVKQLDAESIAPEVIEARKELANLNSSVLAGRTRREHAETRAFSILQKANNRYPHLKDELSSAANEVLGFDITGKVMKDRFAALDAAAEGDLDNKQDAANLALIKANAMKPEFAFLFPGGVPPTPEGRQESVVSMLKAQKLMSGIVNKSEAAKDNAADAKVMSANISSDLKSLISLALDPINNEIALIATTALPEERKLMREKLTVSTMAVVQNAKSFVNKAFANLPDTEDVSKRKDSIMNFLDTYVTAQTDRDDESIKREADLVTIIKNNTGLRLYEAHEALFAIRQIIGEEALAGLNMQRFTSALDANQGIGDAFLDAMGGELSRLNKIKMDQFIGTMSGKIVAEDMDETERSNMFTPAVDYVRQHLESGVPANKFSQEVIDAYSREVALSLQTVQLDSKEESAEMMKVVLHPKFDSMLDRMTPGAKEVVIDTAMKVAANAINADEAAGGALARLRDSSDEWKTNGILTTFDRDLGVFSVVDNTQTRPKKGTLKESVGKARRLKVKSMQRTADELNKYISWVKKNKRHDDTLSNVDDRVLNEVLVEVGGKNILLEGGSILVLGESQLEGILKKQGKALSPEEGGKPKKKEDTANTKRINELQKQLMVLGKQFSTQQLRPAEEEETSSTPEKKVDTPKPVKSAEKPVESKVSKDKAPLKAPVFDTIRDEKEVDTIRDEKEVDTIRDKREVEFKMEPSDSINTLPEGVEGLDLIKADARFGELGEIKNPDGTTSTEYSITEYIGELGGWVNIPLLVKGQVDVKRMLAGGEISKKQRSIAMIRALTRTNNGAYLPIYFSLEGALTAAETRTEEEKYRPYKGSANATEK